MYEKGIEGLIKNFQPANKAVAPARLFDGAEVEFAPHGTEKVFNLDGRVGILVENFGGEFGVGNGFVEHPVDSAVSEVVEVA